MTVTIADPVAVRQFPARGTRWVLAVDDAVRLAGHAGADEVEATPGAAQRQPHLFQLDAESAEAAAALDRAGRIPATWLRGEKEEA